MGPEEEARLRAQMAAARQEADGEPIDLDDPGQVTATPTVISNAPEPNDGYTPIWKPDLGRRLGEAMRPTYNPEGNEFETPDYGYRVGGKTLSAGSAAIPLMPLPSQLALAYAQHRLKGAHESQLRDEHIQALTDQEATVKKAMERAKQIAAIKAQQEKSGKDRDEAIESGHRGYRVERALYPSDLHRK